MLVDANKCYYLKMESNAIAKRVMNFMSEMDRYKRTQQQYTTGEKQR